LFLDPAKTVHHQGNAWAPWHDDGVRYPAHLALCGNPPKTVELPRHGVSAPSADEPPSRVASLDVSMRFRFERIAQ